MYPNPRDDPKGVETASSHQRGLGVRFFCWTAKTGSFLTARSVAFVTAPLCSKKQGGPYIIHMQSKVFRFFPYGSGSRILSDLARESLFSNQFIKSEPSFLKWHPDSYASFRGHRFQISLLSTYFLEQQSTKEMPNFPSNLQKEPWCVSHFLPTTVRIHFRKGSPHLPLAQQNFTSTPHA